uniref:3Beta_HSD domain-containing protein n=1 Tax=Syphacia muris TaxID=451379 RepID=A0A0N5AZZ9_9BILA
MAEVLLICGGNQPLAQHFIRYCQQNDTHICPISEIRTVDKLPFQQFLTQKISKKKFRNIDEEIFAAVQLVGSKIWKEYKFLGYECKIPVKHYQYDLCDECDELDQVFAGCTTVIYCARKNYEYLYTGTDQAEAYQRDNVQASFMTTKRLIKHGIKNLIFVGDAYGNLENCDNYGPSEQMHIQMPKTFILGAYGESIARAEQNVMKIVDEGKVNGISLRPVMLYGEGEKNLIGSMLKHCKSCGGCPNIRGDDRGNHQYIYAGNLAAIVYRCIECLRDDAKRYSGECIYCVDDTACTPFKNFIKSFMEVYQVPLKDETSYFTAFLSSVYKELLYKFGVGKSVAQLTFTAQRFLYGWTVGFSNRKLRLLLDFQPPIQQNEAIEKTLLWYRNNPNFLE